MKQTTKDKSRLINHTLIRDDGEKVLNAHEVTIGFSQQRNGSNRKPIVRCRLSFKPGEEERAAVIAAQLRELVDKEFPGARYEWSLPLSRPSNALTRLLKRIALTLTHLEFRASQLRWLN